MCSGLKQIMPSGYTAAKVYALILFFGTHNPHTHTLSPQLALASVSCMCVPDYCLRFPNTTPTSV